MYSEKRVFSLYSVQYAIYYSVQYVIYVQCTVRYCCTVTLPLCTNYITCVQCRTLCTVQGACILAGYLKLLPLFIMVLPGMAARVLFPDEVGCADPQLCKVGIHKLDGLLSIYQKQDLYREGYTYTCV